MSSILRVGGSAFNVDAFLAQIALVPDRIWRKGESDLKHRIHRDSGFTLVASEADWDDLPQQIAESIAFLKTNHEALQSLQGISSIDYCWLDFAIANREVAGQFDRFPAELLRLAGNLNIGLEISRYARNEADR